MHEAIGITSVPEEYLEAVSDSKVAPDSKLCTPVLRLSRSDVLFVAWLINEAFPADADGVFVRHVSSLQP